MSNILYISMGSNFKWRQVHPKNLRGWRISGAPVPPHVSVRVTGALGNDSHAESGHGLERRKSAKASKACENELQMKARCGAADNFKSRHCNGVVGEQDYHDEEY